MRQADSLPLSPWGSGPHPAHCWWGCKLGQPLWRTVWRFLKKLKTEILYDPAIPLLSTYLEKNQNSKRYNSKIGTSSSVKNAIGDLVRIALNPQIALESIVVLTILSPLIQEHGTRAPSACVALISFSSVLQLSAYGSSVSVGTFIAGVLCLLLQWCRRIV